MTDERVLQVIGERLAGRRLARNLTQQQLAEQAGLGVRTVQRLEQGLAATQLSGFVRVCRVLGLVERFDLFLPETPASPMAQLELRGRPRRRASRRTGPRKNTQPWKWGDAS